MPVFRAVYLVVGNLSSSSQVEEVAPPEMRSKLLEAFEKRYCFSKWVSYFETTGGILKID